MNWTCEQIEERLTDYVDRLMDSAERAGFDRHAASCARCAPLVARVSGMVVALHRLEPLEAPPQLARAILDRTTGPRVEKTGVRGWFGWLQTIRQPRFAYGAVTVVILFAVISQALGIDVRKTKLSDLRPANIYRAADRQAHLVYARGAKFVSDLRVVYEIQSRLRPDSEQPAQSEPQPRKSPAPGQSTGPEQKAPREQNRANEKDRLLTVLACALGAAPSRSMP